MNRAATKISDSPGAVRLLGGADRTLVAGVRNGERRALAKAITLIESTRRDHQPRGQAVLEALLPHTGRSIRVGISGAPGVGKSTFIEALGLYLIKEGHRVAVLAVDPSSTVTGGSILADKTRMEELSRAPQAFIRPSPTGGSMGGVAAHTRETLLVCEAAGFDVIIVETVGVGQSETAVARMTDMIVINKADLDPQLARNAQHTIRSALAIVRPSSPNWQPPVLALSGISGDGIATFWSEVLRYRDTMQATEEFAARRRGQALDWMWTVIDARLRADFRAHPGVGTLLPATLEAVAAGHLTPAMAAERLLARARKD